MRVPDLAVSCSPFELTQPAPTDPVLIVEILSPSNRAETWANVWAYTSHSKRAGDLGPPRGCDRR